MSRTPVKSKPIASRSIAGPQLVNIPKKKPSGIKPAKASREEIEDRRKQVGRLRMRGLGYRSIAKLLGVGFMTVKRDLEAIREDNKKRVSAFEQEQHLGESLSVFEECELRAWQDYHEAGAGTIQRKHFLDTIQDARNNQIKLLTDVGLISKEPAKVDVRVRSELIQHWSPEAQALVAMAILKSKLPAAAEPIPDRNLIEAHSNNVIDIEEESDATEEPVIPATQAAPAAGSPHE